MCLHFCLSCVPLYGPSFFPVTNLGWGAVFLQRLDSTRVAVAAQPLRSRELQGLSRTAPSVASAFRCHFDRMHRPLPTGTFQLSRAGAISAIDRFAAASRGNVPPLSMVYRLGLGPPSAKMEPRRYGRSTGPSPKPLLLDLNLEQPG